MYIYWLWASLFQSLVGWLSPVAQSYTTNLFFSLVRLAGHRSAGRKISEGEQVGPELCEHPADWHPERLMIHAREQSWVEFGGSKGSISHCDSRSLMRVRCRMASSICGTVFVHVPLLKQEQLLCTSFYQKSRQCMLGILNVLIFPLGFPSQHPRWRWFWQGRPVWRVLVMHLDLIGRTGHRPHSTSDFCERKMPRPGHGHGKRTSQCSDLPMFCSF